METVQEIEHEIKVELKDAADESWNAFIELLEEPADRVRRSLLAALVVVPVTAVLLNLMLLSLLVSVFASVHPDGARFIVVSLWLSALFFALFCGGAWIATNLVLRSKTDQLGLLEKEKVRQFVASLEKGGDRLKDSADKVVHEAKIRLDPLRPVKAAPLSSLGYASLAGGIVGLLLQFAASPTSVKKS